MPSPAPPRRVLVVDDFAPYRRWACRLLAQENIQADEAESGKRALSMVLQRDYGAVILDLLLPSISGELLLRGLKADARTSRIPVIAVSGQGERVPYLTALALGAAAAVPKSRPEELVPALRRALSLNGRASSGADVLHIDDDPQWAELVRLWLEERGLLVHHVSDGEELRHYLRHARALPRCLLMDLNLKGQGGLGLCDRIKAAPAFQHLPIIILSGHPTPPVESLRHKAVYHVAKSAGTHDELVAVLESMLEQREHTEGVIDAGDLRLDSRQSTVLLGGRLIARLEHGPFSALTALLRAAPEPVAEDALYDSFLSRHAYRKSDPELTIRQTVRTYVSRLRRTLGPELGARIVHADGGYRYDDAARP